MMKPPLEINVNKDGTVWLRANTLNGQSGMLSITNVVKLMMPNAGHTKQIFVDALAEAVMYDTLTGQLQRALDQAAKDHKLLVEEIGLWKDRAASARWEGLE